MKESNCMAFSFESCKEIEEGESRKVSRVVQQQKQSVKSFN